MRPTVAQVESDIRAMRALGEPPDRIRAAVERALATEACVCVSLDIARRLAPDVAWQVRDDGRGATGAWFTLFVDGKILGQAGVSVSPYHAPPLIEVHGIVMEPGVETKREGVEYALPYNATEAEVEHAVGYARSYCLERVRYYPFLKPLLVALGWMS